MQHAEILLFFFLIALIYASVGFGGGSSYLAILALYELPFKEIRLIALLCNIIVVTGGTIIFIQNRFVNWKKMLPLVIASIPFAFLGARMKISQDNFFVILGISLLAAAILLWIKTGEHQPVTAKEQNTAVRDGFLGGGIGFLSGMVGIGGGIFLSPVLNLARWSGPKQIAATASLFILVNSVSGVAGQLSGLSHDINYLRILMLCVSVLIGGQIGSRLSAQKFNPLVVRRLTALLVFAAGVEVLIRHLAVFKS